ncbi:hypothetical protein KZZ07_04590 [Mameliella sp. CS4]|uniref:hypothetical protein n=1 Tax=Mameliella sp. CS4 TaxID=2862329 RepID=UPI001C5DF727|nr:hypothetical protein [Mameliella sp. CS4]MBW4981815.1 hypothetical protein [Mameliella sp. CS4]
METKVLKTSGIGIHVLLFGLVVVAVGLGLALNILSLRGRSDREALQIVGLIFMFAGAVPFLMGLRLFLAGPKGLHLTPTGFRDARMFRNEIPWSALQDVSIGKSNNGRWDAVLLKVSPDAYKAAGVRFFTRMVTARPDAGIGYTKNMVDTSLEDFGNEVLDYANKARQRAA